VAELGHDLHGSALKNSLLQIETVLKDDGYATSYNPLDSHFLSEVVREILLHLSFAVSALSKQVQDELGICVVSSTAIFHNY